MPYPAPRRSSAMPWIVTGGILVVMALLAVGLFGWLVLVSGGNNGRRPVSLGTLRAPVTPFGGLRTTAPAYPDPGTTYPAYPDPATTDPAPVQYWGAIAVSSRGGMGRAVNYDSESQAESHALNACPSTCKVLVSFVNSCGAVAYNSRTNRYWGGRGSSRTAAENDAISNAGGGRWVAWACTSR